MIHKNGFSVDRQSRFYYNIKVTVIYPTTFAGAMSSTIIP